MTSESPRHGDLWRICGCVECVAYRSSRPDRYELERRTNYRAYHDGYEMGRSWPIDAPVPNDGHPWWFNGCRAAVEGRRRRAFGVSAGSHTPPHARTSDG